MTDELIHMTQRIKSAEEIRSVSGRYAEISIAQQPSMFYGYEQMETHIRAQAGSQHELVMLLEMFIWELESMRKDAMRMGEKDV